MVGVLREVSGQLEYVADELHRLGDEIYRDGGENPGKEDIDRICDLYRQADQAVQRLRAAVAYYIGRRR